MYVIKCTLFGECVYPVNTVTSDNRCCWFVLSLMLLLLLLFVLSCVCLWINLKVVICFIYSKFILKTAPS